MVEVLASLALFSVLLVSLAYTATVGLADVALAKQRQGATALANRLLEEVRALPYQVVARGLRTEELAGDPLVVSCSGVYRFRSCLGEKVVNTPGAPEASPLVPHTGSVGRAEGFPTTYSWSVYVTGEDPSTQPFGVTVVVSWERPARRGAASTLEVQTRLYRAAYSVLPSFYGAASFPQGRLNLSGQVGSSTLLGASLFLPSVSSDASVEQVAEVHSQLTFSGAALTIPGSAGPLTQEAGGDAYSASADSDPATATPDYDGASPAQGAGTTLSLDLGGGNRIGLAITGGDTGSLVAAAAATSSQPCPLAPLPAQQDGEPCGFGRVQQGASLEAYLELGGTSLGRISLARVEAPTAPSWSRTDRERGPGEEGRIEEEVYRALGAVKVAGLPSGLAPPPLWDGYLVSLTGYEARAEAQAGTGTQAPTAEVLAGTVRYYTPTGYASFAVPSGNPLTLTVPPFSLSLPLLGVEVSMTGSLTSGGTSVAETPGSEAGRRLEARAEVGSPLTLDLRYLVKLGGGTLLDLSLRVELGGALARASYEPLGG